MWRSIIGTVVLELISADIGRILNKLSRENIPVSSVRYINDLTVELDINRGDYRRLRHILDNSGTKIRVIRKIGVYWKYKDLLKRPVLSFGVMLYILLVLLIPSRILFVQVEGNRIVPDRMILEAAENCGIVFGANRRQVRSERVKNALLEKIPQLQWVGVNTRGCVAVISVAECQEDKKENDPVAGGIIAKQDAIIQQLTVLRGTQLCRVGQAVKAGQMLVSGYKDYGLSLKFTGAKAEIYGQTEHHLETVTPVNVLQRTRIVRREKKFSLIIGKKQINFYKDSGILPASCVRMYKRTYLTFPGGYTLPLAIAKQEILYYDTDSSLKTDFAFLKDLSRQYLKNQMTAGRILSESVLLSEDGDIGRLSGSYVCLEIIGATTNEELISP